MAIDFHELIETGLSAAMDEAQRRWGPGVFRVRGHTRRGCCVHLTVERAGVEVARWRYELDRLLTGARADPTGGFHKVVTVQTTSVGIATDDAARPAIRPLLGSLAAGLVASLCCGGSLVFASIGPGAAYGSVGLFRYIPQALGLGALLIVGINYWYYRRRAVRSRADDPSCDCAPLRASMLWSGFAGLLMMAASFIFLTWLERGYVKAAQFLNRPEFGQALLSGVRNEQLIYVSLTFLGVPLLAALPLPHRLATANTRGGLWTRRLI